MGARCARFWCKSLGFNVECGGCGSGPTQVRRRGTISRQQAVTVTMAVVVVVVAAAVVALVAVGLIATTVIIIALAIANYGSFSRIE